MKNQIQDIFVAFILVNLVFGGLAAALYLFDLRIKNKEKLNKYILNYNH